MTNDWTPGQFNDDKPTPTEGRRGAFTPGAPIVVASSMSDRRFSAAPPPAATPRIERPESTVRDVWSPERMLRQKATAPASGWRRLLFRVSAGKVNPGPSPAEIERRELTARAKTRVGGCVRIAVVSLKGGVGKTTTTLMLGHTLASIRGDRVVAVDANPDAGTLGFRLRRETRATVRELLAEADRLERYGEVRSFTSQAPSRLEVLASHQDPEISEAFSSDDYHRALAALERFYSVTLTDCGTGILHDAMSAVLACADQLVVVAAPALDGGRSASFLLDWLDAHSYQHLVRGAVVAINATRSRSQVRLDEVTAAFATRCRAVVAIPWDDVLYAGAETTLDELATPTRDAYLRLAAEVADGFPGAGGTRGPQAWSVPTSARAG